MAQNQNQLIYKCLDQLVADKSMTSTELRICLETIVEMYRNILEKSSDDSKYCRIRTSNQRFRSNVWKHFKARTLLLMNGWTVEKDTEDGERYQVIRFDIQLKDNIIDYIKVLMDYKMNVRPDGDQCFRNNEETEQIQEQLKYKEMRQKGAQEREKELQEFRRNQSERQRIASNIKKEIKSDKKYREMIRGINKN